MTQLAAPFASARFRTIWPASHHSDVCSDLARGSQPRAFFQVHALGPAAQTLQMERRRSDVRLRGFFGFTWGLGAIVPPTCGRFTQHLSWEELFSGAPLALGLVEGFKRGHADI